MRPPGLHPLAAFALWLGARYAVDVAPETAGRWLAHSDRIVAAPGPAIKLARSTTFKPEKMFSSAITSPCRVVEPERNELLRFVLHYFGAALTTLEFRRTLCQER